MASPTIVFREITLTPFLGEAALDDGEPGGLPLDDGAGRGGGLPSVA